MSHTNLHNFPPQPTPFIGREPEIAEIVALLEKPDCRLLTLVGSGGMGKTRLSLEAAARHTETFPHGIFFVPLAPLNAASDIVTTVISVLGILIGDEGTPREELIKFLSKRHLLLIMDNFEHVLEGADLLTDILHAAPDVKILVTSREVLNLQEEWVWQVKGMHFPDDAHVTETEKYSALQLFLDRAKRVRRDYDIDSQLPCAIRICQMVGGMPLALELAASWLKTLSCQDVIQQIERGIDFLATRVRDVPKRHRSIRAVFDHSWQLLKPDEQAVFPRLSVFRGGFTLHAAETVTDASLMSISGLVEKSMLRKLPSGRYEIHELLLQYAAEKLIASGETESTQDAHLRYFADFMRDHAIDIKGRRQLEGLNEIEADFENVRTGWQRAIAHLDYNGLDEMVEGIVLYCDMRSHFHDAINLCENALKQKPSSENTDAYQVWNRIRARHAEAWLLLETSVASQKVIQDLEESRQVAEQYDDISTKILCEWLIGEAMKFRIADDGALGSHAARPYLEKALDKQFGKHDLYYKGRILRSLVHSVLHYAPLEEVQRLNKQLIELAEEIDDQHLLGHALLYSGGTYRRQQDWIKVFQHNQRVLNHALYLDDKKTAAVQMSFRGFYKFQAGKFDEALEFTEKAYEIGSQINYYAIVGGSSTVMTAIILITSDTVIDEWLTKVEDFREQGMMLYWSYTVEWVMSLVAIHRNDYGLASQHLHTSLKLYATSNSKNQGIICLPLAVLILNHNGDKQLAVEVMSFIYAHDELTVGWALKWSRFNELREELRQELSQEVYQATWERGSQRDLDTTIDELLAYFSDEEADTPEPIAQPLIEPLTDRELEVLALLAEGMTNREIAEKLFLSVGTVKVHTRNIYGKLDVNNRTEAAAKARDLKLI